MIEQSTLFFSGIEKTSTAVALVQECASGMMSQLLYRDSLLADCKDIPLVIDSGSYTRAPRKRDIEEYAALIQRLGTRGLWYANADEIGNQERSEQNYHFLLSLLPGEMHSRILWIYQASASLVYLHRAIREHAQIGIGGLVPLFQQPDKALAYHTIREIAAIIAGAGQPITPHYFGVSILPVIQELHSYHRVFSTDSTTWLVGGKYGLAVARDGKQRSMKELGYDFTTDELLKQNVRTMRRWMDRDHARPAAQHWQSSWLEEVAV